MRNVLLRNNFEFFFAENSSLEEISRELSKFNLRSQSQETPQDSDQEDPENPENLDQNYQVLIYPLSNLEDDLDKVRIF